MWPELALVLLHQQKDQMEQKKVAAQQKLVLLPSLQLCTFTQPCSCPSYPCTAAGAEAPVVVPADEAQTVAAYFEAAVVVTVSAWAANFPVLV